MPARTAEENGQLQQWAEKAASDAFDDLNMTPEPEIEAEVAAGLAGKATPVPDHVGSGATKLLADEIAEVMARHGRAIDPGAIEARLLATGEQVVTPDGEPRPDDVEERARLARLAAEPILMGRDRTLNMKKVAVYEAIKASPPFMFFNPEARWPCINGYRFFIPAGRIDPKKPGEAGLGCLFVARLVQEFADARMYEDLEKRRLKEQVLYGDDYDVDPAPDMGRGWSPLLPPPM